ncbi:hypothetical protein [Sphingobium yanoikuyae]|uniref:Phasin domain-containing protein n=1 Tax=Sphingobium yanoikuyae TaxID=13690 RepID=A0A291MUE8_SPHYA|nr:hypothetical protein [Sphingobium yanoikuyae]ATI78702.1 hypothetical protein A6768_00980 [Sphingobium yanoikuyae]
MEAMMASAIENGMVLWMWPLTAARLASDWLETMTIARTVIDARMPMIAAAWTNPFTANHSELTRMVTEKTSALGASQKTISSAQETVRRASEANARALGRLTGGGWLDWSEWTKIVERNLEIATTLAMLPTGTLAPIHSKATANARRLAKP